MGGIHELNSRTDLTWVGSVVYGADREVGEWAAERIPGGYLGPDAKALGVVKNGNLIAGVIYDNFNGVNVEMSIATEPGSFWADRSTLHSVFHYPFVTMGCEAVTISVAMSNVKSLNLVTKLGFEPEAIIGFAARDGSSLLILKMFKDKCRWIDYGQATRRIGTPSPRPEGDGAGRGGIQPD